MKDNMGSKRNTDSMEEKTKKPTDKEILIPSCAPQESKTKNCGPGAFV